MTESKKPDDFIIDDEVARQLIAVLSGKWGDPQTELFAEAIWDALSKHINRAEGALHFEYPSEIYNKTTGHKTTLRAYQAFRAKLIEEAYAIFQSSLAPVIKQALFSTINALVNASSDQVIKPLKERCAKELKQYDTARSREMRKALRQSVGKDIPPLGRRTRYKPGDVERLSIEIIRAIGAKKGDEGKVAAVFYSGDIGNPDSSERGKLLKPYLAQSSDERQKTRSKYSALLKYKGLTFEGLLKKAGTKDKSKVPKKKT